MKINERGFWENPTAEGHAHDEGIAKALVEFFRNQPKSFPILFVVDVGCGDGFYTNYINANAKDEVMCWGMDGNPATIELAGPNTYVVDFTEPLVWTTYDWVLCLEVGEHIPQEFEKVFLDNLDKLNKNGIILSWAVPGQGGDGHINCQTNEEVISKLKDYGYEFRPDESRQLREKSATFPTPCYWFRDTLMVFRRIDTICSKGYDTAI